jgi:phage tail sheath protein FI
MAVIKTPGVYVEEISLIPPSVAEVATAIPAFIGYTEFALDGNLNPITLPVKISSLLEYGTLFGGPYDVKNYTVKVDTSTGNTIKSAVPDKRYFLYDIVRQYYDNGGGECYIVSVGSYTDAVITFAKLSGGIDQVKKFDEPTLIVFPEGVLLKDGGGLPDLSNLSNLQKQALSQCNDLKDRFTLMDIMQGDLKEDATNKPITNFRDNVGVNFLSYGAAYYPWVITNYGANINFRQLKFIDQADAPIANIGPFSISTTETALVTEVTTKIGDTDNAMKDVGTGMSTPNLDLAKLRSGGVDFISSTLSGIENEVRTGGAFKTRFTDYLQLLSTIARAFPKAEAALGANSPAKTELLRLKTDTKLIGALKALALKEKNAQVIANTLATRDAAAVKTIYDELNGGWYGAGITFTTLAPPDAGVYSADRNGSIAIIRDLQPVITDLLLEYSSFLNAALYYENLAINNLFSSHRFFKGVSDKIKEAMNTIPPSGAVAGVYALTDRNRGVWKAPANVSLNAVIGPAVKIDNRDQEDLNVHSTGKSINAIRAFTGKGTLVWGARTLAGNDNEWRYVPVRRFFIMVEESVKKATEPFVFEPNDANTWTKVKGMIENFLTLQWRAGALMGAKPNDAFFVHVGLGETMTEDDVLNGKMIVEIGMAAVRPAEFIILRFSHKMMEK